MGNLGEDSAATGVDGDQAANPAGDNSGAVHVFTRAGTAWSQRAYVKASNSGQDDFFGSAVALTGGILAVGSNLEDSDATGIDGDQLNDAATDSGAVYLRKIAP